MNDPIPAAVAELRRAGAAAGLPAAEVDEEAADDLVEADVRKEAGSNQPSPG